MLAIAILTLVCVLTYSVEIVFGLGGTVLMLPLLGFWFDTKTLVIYSTLPQIAVATIGIARSPKTVETGFLARMLGVAMLGALAGLYLFYLFPGNVFQLLLAGMITLSGLFLIVSPQRLRIPATLARFLDLLAGVSQGLLGISGPIAMTRLLGTFENKTIIRNYALAFFLPLNVLRLAGYATQETLTPEIVEMMAWSAPFLIAGLWYANHLHFRVRETHFRKVIAWLILLGGVSLFYR